jgi:hypothetical protein
MPNTWALVSHLRYERSEARIEKDNTVVGMVHDPTNLFRKESRIDGVRDRPHARTCVINLQVPMAIPSERSDAIAGANTQSTKCVCELAGTPVRIGIPVAMNRSLDSAGDNLRVPMVSIRMLNERRNDQRQLHHRSVPPSKH